MFTRKFFTLILIVLVSTLIFAACAPAPTPVPTAAPATKAPAPSSSSASSVAPTSVPATSAPVATKAPAPTTAPTVVPTTAAATPKKGGKINVAVWQSPTTLNPLLNTQTVENDILSFIVEGLTSVLPDGTRVGTLAVEPPSTKNGGVSTDGKTITYKLKPNVQFSDGSPLACEDVKYTWQVRMTKGVGIGSTTGFDKIGSIECPDPLTVVVKYKEYYAAYYTLFGEILPRSAGDAKDIGKWAYNRNPIGTGPFKVTEFVADDHLTLARNDKYRDAAASKPYLDQIVVRMVPSVEVATQLLLSGEVDVLWNPKLDQMPIFDKTPGVKYTAPPRGGGETIFFNMSENKDPADPTKPHMILGDQRVRMAIAVGVNWHRITDELFYGKAKVSTSALSEGEWRCDPLPPEYEYSTDKAKQLLTDAGWIPGPDGIRVAKGAKYAPDGTRLRLQFMTTTGDDVRERTQLLVIEDMRKAGMEIYVQNAPSSVSIGNWAAGAPRVHGNFDILMHNAYTTSDPQSYMERFWASWTIPSPSNQGGLNEPRFTDPKFDAMLKQAASEVDQSKRKTIFCELAQILHDQVPMIYTYQALRIFAYHDRIQGWGPGNAWDNLGWNSSDWWVSK